MGATFVSISGDTVTYQVEIKLSGSMLEMEGEILDVVNAVGTLATQDALERFDSDGLPIVFGGEKWFSKGHLPKSYQTPYGVAEAKRHVYQRSKGGKTYCPMERDARIVVTSTPRFAKQISHKFANFSSSAVRGDLKENPARVVARSYLQGVAEAVGSVAQAKEESWRYAAPKLDRAVKAVSIGLDGTFMLMCDLGYREAMAGTLSLYDSAGERLHTIYLGATPEYGKGKYTERLEREIAHIKTLYPEAEYVGIADGASTNWDFLEQHTTLQVLDFYHATTYLADVAMVAFPKDTAKREVWMDQHCHDLKHKQGAATRIYKEMLHLAEKRLSEPIPEKLTSAITYFRNHKHQMHYARYRANNLPIGSGVTEAACKTLVKQRLCQSGMRWVDKGARIVLSLRALVLTKERWQQFWDKIDQYGFPVAA